VGKTTRDTWPDETAEQVVERTRTVHGDRAAEAARRLIDSPTPPRPDKRGPDLVGVRPKRPPSWASKPGDRGGRDDGVDPTRLDHCPVCGRSRIGVGPCDPCRKRKAVNRSAGRRAADVGEAERAEIVRQLNRFVAPRKVALEHDLPVDTVQHIAKMHRKHRGL
jgi:hypothetical protein